MDKITDYNNEVQNWDFNKNKGPEFLRLLTERNSYIQEQTPIIDFHKNLKNSSKNIAVINSTSIKKLENIAFHIGSPHQKKLYTLIEKETGNKNNKGVFFSLNLEDVIYFSEFQEKPFSMIYFSDLNSAKNARIQTKYDSPIISRYEIDDMLIINEGVKKSVLKKAHKELNNKWIKENTIPFNVNQLNEFKKKGYDWLVIPDPIKVKY